MSNENDFSWFGRWFAALVDNVGKVVKGKRDEVGMVVLALFSGGHVLLEDYPGTGKTTLAKALAASVDATWNRIQFTPDLLPSDVTGGMIFDQKESKFEFHRGPIFANIVLADEINRASPKTQSALLQVMEEGEITVDGNTYGVGDPFIVLATQNPVEQAGTYRLPEAQLDRFMIKLSLGYPDHESEVEVLDSIGRGIKPSDINAIISAAEVSEMAQAVASVYVAPEIQSYIVRLCAYTRDSRRVPEVRLGVSPRGAVALMKMARAAAAANSSHFVAIDHVAAVAPFVMTHRMLLTPEAELNRVSAHTLIERVLREVEQPAAIRR